MDFTRLNLNQAATHRFSQALYACMEEVGSTKGALYLHDPDRQEFYLVATYGWPRGLQPPELIRTDDPFLVWVHRERRTFVLNEAGGYPELAVLNVGPEPSRYLISPVYDHGDWVGLLIQRDRVRGGPYDLDRDEGPTAQICESIVSILQEFGAFLAGEAQATVPVIPLNMDWIPGALTGAEGGTEPASAAVQPLPVEVPRSEALVPTLETDPRESLEGFQVTAAGQAFAPMAAAQDTELVRFDDSRELPQEAPEASQSGRGTQPSAPDRKVRPGTFLPEQRTFFWEAAALLSQCVEVDAVALWMSEPDEVRPILTYSQYPLSSDLKQQIMAHVTFHLNRVSQQELRIHSRAEWMEQEPLAGVFQTYLPVVLMEEEGSNDMLLLFRMRHQPFTDPEIQRIQQVGRMLGYHLQEGRLHERYHKAFLSVSHRLLLSADARAPELRPHSMNTAKLARALALRLDLASAEVEAVSIAAILHDVGTLLLDPAILAKGRLSVDEMAKMRTHPLLAAAFLRDFRFPYDVLKIIRHHHERFDGRGYPDGLQGDAIPIGSRIIALIEAYEVMSSGKGYKTPKPQREILEEFQREAGAQFDPVLVAEFLPLVTGTWDE